MAVIGLALFAKGIYQLNEIKNAWYVSESYGTQTKLMLFGGFMLLFSGGYMIVSKLFKTRYQNKHIKEVTPVAQSGGITTCAKCGLSLTASTKFCPRCGQQMAYRTGGDGLG